jgi:hypothetical protein
MKRLAPVILAFLISIVFWQIVLASAAVGTSNAAPRPALTAPALAQPRAPAVAFSNTIYFPLVMSPPPRVLWADDCSRSSPYFCPVSNSLTILNEFYAALNDIGATIQFSMPHSLDQLRQYDVVIAEYCSGLYGSPAVPLLSQYIAQGGSVIVLGDNFCIVGGDDQGNVSAARAANILVSSLGMTFTVDDVTDVQFSDQIIPHPTTVNVATIYSFRHAYVEIGPPATAIVLMNARPFIGVYDGAGTVIAIPNVGFHWGNSFQQVAASDNFVFWRNSLKWLAQQSRMKQLP